MPEEMYGRERLLARESLNKKGCTLLDASFVKAAWA
jgi:hypothetical protein